MNWDCTRDAGLGRLEDFLPRAGRAYADRRNHDTGPVDHAGLDNVSVLSPWLHAGLLDEAEVVERTLHQHSPDASEKFIAEVFWRVYFKGYLEQRPSIWRSYCEGRDSAFNKLNSNSGMETAYLEAVEGRTGIRAFDVWARELVETGYLHNHARMWFASIWIFTLKIDWHLGADLFLRHLVDGDAASNTLSWRWIGGLHTKGKTYLATPDNIAKFTQHRKHGVLSANGLADEAVALTEAEEHPRQPLDLPSPPDADAFEQPYALILHDEGASHVPLHLKAKPALVIGAASPRARSPGETGKHAMRFANDAIEHGVNEAAAAFACGQSMWTTDNSLEAILKEAEIKRVVTPYLTTGWTRDTLWPELEAVARNDDLVQFLPDLQRATWPHAKAGFFGVKKKIQSVLGEIGVSAAA